MNILVTSSRLPFALDAIRKLGRTGHGVYASDTFSTAPGSHSKHVRESFVTASPRYATGSFLDDLASILRQHPIDRLMPAFEEVFYIAKHRSRFEGLTEVYAPSFETLRRLHDKTLFFELAKELKLELPPTIIARDRDELAAATREFPRFFARPAYTRGGVLLFTNTGPLAGELDLEECEPTESNPFLVQPFVEGEDVCTYSIVHHGRIRAHASYVHPLTLEHAGGIVFESIDSPETVRIASAIAEAVDYHGQLSFDFMRTERGYVLIECNPRPTAGLTVMPDAMLEDAMMDRHPERTLIAPAGARRKISLALIRNIVVRWEEVPRTLEELVSSAEDLYVSRGDILPLLYQLIAYSRVIGYRFKTGRIRRTDLMQGYFDDICWNGEEILG